MELYEEVVIVRGGIASLATAIGLKRVGLQSLVLERAEDLRTTVTALTLSPNAWRALDARGVSFKLISLYDPLQKDYVTEIRVGQVRQVSFVTPGCKGTKLSARPVHRTALLEALAEELTADWIRFSSKLASFDQTQVAGGGHIVTARLEDGTIIKSKVLIGCDGVHFVMAKWLGLPAAVHSDRWLGLP